VILLDQILRRESVDKFKLQKKTYK